MFPEPIESILEFDHRRHKGERLFSVPVGVGKNWCLVRVRITGTAPTSTATANVPRLRIKEHCSFVCVFEKLSFKIPTADLADAG
jgi:hypothetical protein